MSKMINLCLLSLALALLLDSRALLIAKAFIVSPKTAAAPCQYHHKKTSSSRILRSSSLKPSCATATTVTATDHEQDLGMTPELKKVTDAFASIQEEQIRYKQLLYMAQSTEEVNNLPESSKTPENKVPGCLSTVYVDGTAKYDDKFEDYVINFQGDSDGLMTKGLVALLVRCLSGNTAKVIQNVDPQFIKLARIDQSLTPGRNNGFLNMLQSLKNKALALDEAAREEGAGSISIGSSSTTDEQSSALKTDDGEAMMTNGTTDNDDDNNNGSKYTAIVQALQAIKPTSLQLVDNSDMYDKKGEESHFELYIVAPAFEGLNVIKRQQLVYMMVGDLMPQIEALQITSLTPDEAK